MSNYDDWYPNRRDDIMAMCTAWEAQLDLNGSMWGVPSGTIQVYHAVAGQTRAIFAKHKLAEERTPVNTAECAAAFNGLEELSRRYYKSYLDSPPRTDAERVALLLPVKDRIRTPTGRPSAVVRADVFLRGIHELGFQIVYMSGNEKDPSNKGYRVWYLTAAPGEEPPTNPEQLTKSFFTRRNRDFIEFDFGDSGKRAFIAVQIENGKKKGPWGPLVQAVIP